VHRGGRSHHEQRVVEEPRRQVAFVLQAIEVRDELRAQLDGGHFAVVEGAAVQAHELDQSVRGDEPVGAVAGVVVAAPPS
jgi:hypothetical protein